MTRTSSSDCSCCCYCCCLFVCLLRAASSCRRWSSSRAGEPNGEPNAEPDGTCRFFIGDEFVTMSLLAVVRWSGGVKMASVAPITITSHASAAMSLTNRQRGVVHLVESGELCGVIKDRAVSESASMSPSRMHAMPPLVSGAHSHRRAGIQNCPVMHSQGRR